eukprot:scaffold23127_cov112-Isochrysis_galbana.AAC.4
MTTGARCGAPRRPLTATSGRRTAADPGSKRTASSIPLPARFAPAGRHRRWSSARGGRDTMVHIGRWGDIGDWGLPVESGVSAERGWRGAGKLGRGITRATGAISSILSPPAPSRACPCHMAMGPMAHAAHGSWFMDDSWWLMVHGHGRPHG